MTRPWESAELPSPVTPMYVCPGDDRHSIEFHFANDLRWMQGQPGTPHTEDDYYYDQCIHDAERDVGRGMRTEVVLGSTLYDELTRRGG